MPLKLLSSLVLIATLLLSPLASGSRFSRGRAIQRLIKQSEIAKLRAENNRLRMNNDISKEQLRNNWIAERSAILAENGFPPEEAGQSLESLIAPWLGSYITYTADFTTIVAIARLHIIEGRGSKSIVLDRWSDGLIMRLFDSPIEDLPSRILDLDKSMRSQHSVAISRHGEVFGASTSRWRLLLAFYKNKNKAKMVYEIEKQQITYSMEVGEEARLQDRETQRKLKPLDDVEFERGGVLPTQFINGLYGKPPVVDPCVVWLTPTQ